jgi:hypothetical protein
VHRIIAMFALGLSGCPTPIHEPTLQAQVTESGSVTAYSPLEKNTEPKANTGQAEVIDVGELIVPINTERSRQAQAKIRAGHHRLYSGEIICNGCRGPFVVKITHFVNPSGDDPRQAQSDGPTAPTCGVGTHGANVRFPPILVASPGSFEIATPWHGGAVVLEVVEDKDGNGVPSAGEPFVVLHEDGGISGREDRAGLVVDMDKAPPMVTVGPAAVQVKELGGQSDQISP